MEAFLINGSLIFSIIVYTVGAILLFALVRFRAPLVRFYGEVSVELGKCTWPWDPEQKGLRKYKQLIDSTVLVVVLSIMTAGYVTCFDFLIKAIVRFLAAF